MDTRLSEWRLSDPRSLTEIPGVLGTGFGLRVSDVLGETFPIPVVKVFVAGKRPSEELSREERIPSWMPVAMAGASGRASVLDLPTDVVELPEPPAAKNAEGAQGYPGSARAGDRVRVDGIRPGTLGCIATRRSTGESVLVSCYHVLISEDGAPYPPGPIPQVRIPLMDLWVPNGSMAFDQPVGRVITGAHGGSTIHFDVAVAKITRPPADGGPVRRMRGTKRHPDRYLSVDQAIGRQVRKYGAASTLTCGTVTGLVSEVTLPSGLRFAHTLVVENREPGRCTRCSSGHLNASISQGGDSGCLWITDEDPPVVIGLHLAGDGVRKAYVLPWAAIEATAELDVTIR